jgi:hypothetical protein
MGNDTEERPRRHPSLLIAFLFFVLLPAAALFGLDYVRRTLLDPPYGAQPGGVIEGRVVDMVGKPLADVDVRLLLVTRESDATRHSAVTSGTTGRFSLAAPPLADGYYVVEAGDGAWQVRAAELSLAGSNPSPLQLELAPAAYGVVVLSPLADGPAHGGSWLISGRGRSMLGFTSPMKSRGGTFEEDRFEFGGIPPGTWDLHIELEQGPAADVRLQLTSGDNRIEIPPLDAR